MANTVAAFSLQESAVAKFLWPNAQVDPSLNEYPLPPGDLGCPFLGSDIWEGNAADGPETFYESASARIGNPWLWKFYYLGNPAVVVSGVENIRSILDHEFDTMSSPESIRFVQDPFFGKDRNLVFEQERSKHKALRRLIQRSMGPNSITKALPLMQDAAESHIDSLLANRKGRMSEVGSSYVSDVIGQIVVGLDACHRGSFAHSMVTWRSTLSLLNLRQQKCVFAALAKLFKGGAGMMTIKSIIERRIQSAKQSGAHDGSSLSDFVFATNADGSRMLNHNEILKNTMMLATGGFETTTHTLTLTSLLLGLNKDFWNKLVQEQEEMVSRHGKTITKKVLDESIYLDCVINESLRLGAVAAKNPRKLKASIVIDGQQVPKGYSVVGGIRLTHEQDPVTYREDGLHMDVRKGFQPERWLEEDTRPREFMPFGVGRRYCPGAKLACAELKVFFALLARKADFELVSSSPAEGDVEWDPLTSIRTPADGALVHAVARGTNEHPNGGKARAPVP